MGDWNLFHGGGAITSSGLGTTSRGKVVTASGSTNTKGSPTELIASTAYEASGVYVNVHSNTGATQIFMDLMIGASTEDIIVPDLVFSRSNQINMDRVYLPIKIPKGSRVSARTQGSVASSLLYVMLQLIPSAPTYPAGFGRCTAYGLTAASTTMTSVDAGGTADTEGAWTQITASTTNPIRSMIVGVGPGSDITTGALCYFQLDIGVGSATEAAIISDMSLVRETASDQPKPIYHGPYPCNIPAGTRLAARAQCSVNTAGDRVIEVGIWGFD